MRRTVLDLLLAGGFFALAAAILIARRSPPVGYELSIYSGTPTAVWVALGVALSVALGVTLAARGVYQGIGITLGAGTVTAVVALPAVRNYRFQGRGDGLTHVGWTAGIVEGSMAPQELFYPGVHAVGSALSLVAGVPIERALMIAVVAVFVPFVVFVPLVVREISTTGAAVGFAAVASWLVLPINNVATHTGVHPNSNALFFAPVVLFAIVAYLNRGGDLEPTFGVSAYSLVLVVLGVGMLAIHPQQFINVVVLLGVISAVQFVARGRYADHPIVEQPTAYAHTAVFAALFAVWVVSNERFRRAFSGLVYGVFVQDIGTGGEVEQRDTSLAEIGATLDELFAKMFLVSALVALVVALFVLVVWLGKSRVGRETKAFVTYFGLALAPLGVMFGIYFVGTANMAFRQVGFMFVVVTILAGIGLARGVGWLSRGLTAPGANVVASVALGACLVLSLMIVFSSPFIYVPSQQVTDQTMSGYGSAIDHGEDRPYAGFGHGVDRYGHAIEGLESEEMTNYEGTGLGEVDVDEFEDGNYGDAYGGVDYYFAVDEYDTTREFEVWRGLHHSEEALEGVDAYPGADKVVANEEFRLYAIDGG